MESRKSYLAIVVACLIAVFGVLGCSEEEPLSSDPSAPSLARVASGPAELEGEIGPGSVYRIDVPERWNGDLVLYAHGFRDVAEPIAPPTGDDWTPKTSKGLSIWRKCP